MVTTYGMGKILGPLPAGASKRCSWGDDYNPRRMVGEQTAEAIDGEIEGDCRNCPWKQTLDILTNQGLIEQFNYRTEVIGRKNCSLLGKFLPGFTVQLRSLVSGDRPRQWYTLTWRSG